MKASLLFFVTIEKVFNEMAPIRKLTRKESNLLSRPWITSGILKSIKDRYQTHHLFVKEKDQIKKNVLFQSYKIKRNMIKSLIKKSKRDYYMNYFEEHKSNIKKTWEGIRNIVNISKRSRVVPVEINYKNEIKSNKKEMAESFNDFFVGIGNMVEKKIPTGNKHFSTFLDNSNPTHNFPESYRRG